MDSFVELVLRKLLLRVARQRIEIDVLYDTQPVFVTRRPARQAMRVDSP